MRRWVDEVRESNPGLPYFDVDATAFGTPDAEITSSSPAGQHLAARLRVHAVHASQTSPFDDLSEELRTDVLGAVHLRRITPAAEVGVLEHDFI